MKDKELLKKQEEEIRYLQKEIMGWRTAHKNTLDRLEAANNELKVEKEKNDYLQKENNELLQKLHDLLKEDVRLLEIEKRKLTNGEFYER